MHDTIEGAKTSMFGSHVFNIVERAAACSSHVPNGDVGAINPFLVFANSSRH